MRAAQPGRHSRRRITVRSGRYVRAAPFEPGERAGDLAVDATLRAAAARRASDAGASSEILAEDLRRKIRVRPNTTLAVFAVDASESMETAARMAAAKGAILGLLSGAYHQRHRVALVVFRGEAAQVVLPPTSSVTLAQARLRRLPSGGATPFADGLLKAWEIVRRERARDPEIRPLLVVVSDGQANIALGRNADPIEEIRDLARKIRREHVQSILIDTSPPAALSGGAMRRIAESLGAVCHHIDRLRASELLDAIQEAEQDAIDGRDGRDGRSGLSGQAGDNAR